MKALKFTIVLIYNQSGLNIKEGVMREIQYILYMIQEVVVYKVDHKEDTLGDQKHTSCGELG